MKVTIVTASFNQGAYISKMIDSVRCQSGAFQLEHIILDNCSTDETPELLNAYKANPGKVEVRIIVERDRGQTEAINKGFSLATGDVVAWINTDEWLENGAIQRVVEEFEKDATADVLFGWCDYVDGLTGATRSRQERFFSRSMLLYYGCFVPSCSTFVRRRVLDNGEYLDESYRVVMDYEWYTRLAFAGYSFRPIPLKLANFLWHATNISSVQHSRRREERRKVQAQYSRIAGWEGFRRLFFPAAFLWWTGVRVGYRNLHSGLGWLKRTSLGS